MKFAWLTSAVLLLAVFWVVLSPMDQRPWQSAPQSVSNGRTVSEAMRQFGPDAERRLASRFVDAGVAYPPKQLALLALKQQQMLELWASDEDQFSLIHNYPIKRLSGVAGPKLREGDRQVPEGIYQTELLNPNSAYHLSIKLNYPNAFDLTHARQEGRSQPGSNIFIHGKAVSIGCLAMGDPAIEELFVLSKSVGLTNIDVLIAPSDPRVAPLVVPNGSPPWVSELYRQLEQRFKPFTK